jgi:hypothetical protein
MIRRFASPLTTFLMMLIALSASAGSPLVKLEDWSGVAVGTRGIPPGWEKTQSWGNPNFDFTVVQEGPKKVLHLLSRGDSSTISKEVKVDVKQTPILEWQWKAVALPRRADARRKATDDQALQLYVVFERSPALVRSRIIGYIWDSSAPEGAIVRSEKSGLITYVVVRSGTRDLGKWLSESRNVYEDYKRIYGEEPGELARAVSIAIDSDDTASSAEGYVGEILFRTPQ